MTILIGLSYPCLDSVDKKWLMNSISKQIKYKRSYGSTSAKSCQNSTPCWHFVSPHITVEHKCKKFRLNIPLSFQGTYIFLMEA